MNARDVEALLERRRELNREIDDVVDRLERWPGPELRLILRGLVDKLNSIDRQLAAARQSPAA
jgi:hypothetical protein